MYLCASSGMDQPELIQTAGRLCVATPRGDNVPLTLYTTKDVEKDLVKAYWLQEELIERADREYKVSDNPLWKLIQDIPIYKGKIPTKNRSLTKKVKYELNDIDTKEDGGYEFDRYVIDTETEIETEFDENDDEKCISIRYSKLSRTELETYNLIEEYFAENYNTGWIQREKIGKWIMKKIEITNSQTHAKFEHLIGKRNKKVDSDCIIFKKVGTRWSVRKL